MGISEKLEVLMEDSRYTWNNKFTIIELLEVLLPFHEMKDIEYNSSWAKRGLLGLQHGYVLHQADRIEPGFNRLVDSILNVNDLTSPSLASPAKSLLDTLTDNVLYSLMAICFISSLVPYVGDEYLEKMRKYVADRTGESTEDGFLGLSNKVDEISGELIRDLNEEKFWVHVRKDGEEEVIKVTAKDLNKFKQDASIGGAEDDYLDAPKTQMMAGKIGQHNAGLHRISELKNVPPNFDNSIKRVPYVKIKSNPMILPPDWEEGDRTEGEAY